MELIEGITLKSYMNKTGALPTKELLSYTEQILKALEQAHSKNIIHRDIKPQNIMLLRSGRIKVTDFGIAKLPTPTRLP
jgi:serine/threonine protein kinase